MIASRAHQFLPTFAGETPAIARKRGRANQLLLGLVEANPAAWQFARRLGSRTELVLRNPDDWAACDGLHFILTEFARVDASCAYEFRQALTGLSPLLDQMERGDDLAAHLTEHGILPAEAISAR
ncbi:MAG: hypothetical protein HYT42_01020 [Candidatus Sungbacteria bacterium]|nr:hypothetical protein [Candidatus Sungbacteria bacterium]